MTNAEPDVEVDAAPPLAAQPLDAWFGRGFDPAPPAPLPAIATRVARPPNDDDAESLVVSAMADARAALARAFGRG